MRLINLLIALLIVAVLTVTAYKLWFPKEGGGSGAVATPPSARFMRTCQETSANIRRSERYCRCLWGRGVKNLGTLFTSARSRQQADACKAEAEGTR